MFSNTSPASARGNIFGQTTPIAQGNLTINPNAMMTLQQNPQEMQQQQLLQQQQFQQWQQQQQFQQQQPQQQLLQQQQLQQQQQQQTGQDQQYQQGQQQYSNQAQYGQQYQPYYVPEPQNYTNPNAIPDKINLEFYGIVDRVFYIKAYLVLRLRNWQIIYHCNQANRAVSESEARVIVKNFLDFQQLEYDGLYQVTTEEGFWILKITDLDRVYMVFYDKNYRKDLAFSLFEEYYKTITQQDFLKVSDHIELFNQISQKLQELTEAYEQKLLENKDPSSAIEYERADFQQNCFQIGLNQQCFITCVEKLKPKTVINQIHPAFQGSNLINDFKANFQPILSICICLMLVVIVVLLLYNFVIKGIFILIQIQLRFIQNQLQDKKNTYISLINDYYIYIMDEDQNEKEHLANDGRQMTLIDQIIRNKVFNCRYWKEDCFGLTAVTLVDKAIKLDCVGRSLYYVGGTYSGTGKPTPFLCLLMKLLQINPEKAIITEFLQNKDYKYINALSMFYLRLTQKPKELYPAIEQYFSDFRKLRIRNLDGTFELWHIDEFAEKLLSEENLFGISLPRLQKRWILEENGQLEPRRSVLEEELEEQNPGDQQEPEKLHRSESPSRKRSRSRSHKKHRKHKHK